jgi:hypothetical protein
MHEACVVWGFCGCSKNNQTLHFTLLIPPEGPVTATQFVDWLFLADNLNPASEPERWVSQKEALRTAFVRHMGAETVDAGFLRWSDCPPDDNQPKAKFRREIRG